MHISRYSPSSAPVISGHMFMQEDLSLSVRAPRHLFFCLLSVLRLCEAAQLRNGVTNVNQTQRWADKTLYPFPCTDHFRANWQCWGTCLLQVPEMTGQLQTPTWLRGRGLASCQALGHTTQGMAAPARAYGQDLGCSLGSETPPGGVGAQGGRSHTCRDNTIYIACLLLLVEKVGSGCFQLFVIAGHHCHMVDLVGGHMLHRETWKCGVTA